MYALRCFYHTVNKGVVYYTPGAIVVAQAAWLDFALLEDSSLHFQLTL